MSATLDRQISSSESIVPCKRTPSRSDSDTMQGAPEELPSFTTLLAEGKGVELHDEFDASQSDLSASQSTVVEDDEDEADQLNASQYIMTQPTVPGNQGVDQTQSGPSKEEPQNIQSSVPSLDSRNVETHPPSQPNVACLIEGPYYEGSYYANSRSPTDEIRRQIQQNVASLVEGPNYANHIPPRDETLRMNHYINAEGGRSRKSRRAAQQLVTLQQRAWECPAYKVCKGIAHNEEDMNNHVARCGYLSQMRSEHLSRIGARLRAPEATPDVFSGMPPAVARTRPNEDPDFKKWCEDLLTRNGPHTIAPSNRALLLKAFNKGLEIGSSRENRIRQILCAAAFRAHPPVYKPYSQTPMGSYHASSGMRTPSDLLRPMNQQTVGIRDCSTRPNAEIERWQLDESSFENPRGFARGPYEATEHLRHNSRADRGYPVGESERPMRPQDPSNAQNNEGVGAVYSWPK